MNMGALLFLLCAVFVQSTIYSYWPSNRVLVCHARPRSLLMGRLSLVYMHRRRLYASQTIEHHASRIVELSRSMCQDVAQGRATSYSFGKGMQLQAALIVAYVHIHCRQLRMECLRKDEQLNMLASLQPNYIVVQFFLCLDFVVSLYCCLQESDDPWPRSLLLG